MIRISYSSSVIKLIALLLFLPPLLSELAVAAVETNTWKIYQQRAIDLESKGDLKGAELAAMNALNAGQQSSTISISDDISLDNTYAAVLAKQGKYIAAIEIYKHALVIASQHFESYSADTARSEDNIARMYVAVKDYSQAETLYRHSLKIRLSSSLSNAEDVCNSLNNIAGVNLIKHQYNEASFFYLQAIRLYSEKNNEGLYKNCLLSSFDRLAGSYSSLGKLSDAEDISRRALATREDIYGRSDVKLTENLMGLSLTLKDQAKYDQAVSIDKRIIDIFRNVYGDDNSKMIVVLDDLAEIALLQGDDRRAESILEDALRIRQMNFGSDRSKVDTGWFLLADLYRKRKDYGKSESIYRSVVDRYLSGAETEKSNALFAMDNLLQSISENGTVQNPEDEKRARSMIRKQ